jgi:hypothetical protein
MADKSSHPRYQVARRPLLWAGLAAAFGAALGAPFRARAVALGGGAPDPLAALGPWLDTLIPADVTPSATALGVGEALIAQARLDQGAMPLLAAGCQWLEAQAQQRGAADFASVPETAREEIARRAAAAAPGTPQRSFFDNTWRLGVFHYYARPEVWASLGYAGPPQPKGFPDADRPP